FFNATLHEVGKRARDANRVEVPFEFVAPPRDQWWKADTRDGVSIPVGRTGAVKRQCLDLGQGVAHHVLIAGKTGSGKSTLLHALITNAALMYSPDELELYLVDFKKGVEFKTYAAHRLPHARVIAVESEREFGLSVLQRLDAELVRRGELFRELSVQDVPSFRANSEDRMPRILLVVDEFQEFFVEDDRVAQDAALLLDRLVRQGRAFGIHVLFGSQTLGGSYSLARSTIGQMAVRIALQCSEADAHLILSEDNPAARLLTRPGEAIYNDANGLVEGNNIFQVVYLGDDSKEKYLGEIQTLAKGREGLDPLPQVIFEGNVPAELASNDSLRRLLQAPDWDEEVVAPSTWLGEPVAIKEPTAAVFRPQSGSHLLMIGQHGEAAMGVMSSLLISLAAQHPPAESLDANGARFYVLDGSPADSNRAGALGQLAESLGHEIQMVSHRDLPGVMTELAAELERRQQSPEQPGASVYLLVYDLSRFRELRKKDDDFGFSRMGE
ncbi:MAG: FtsK/SpoIIIE domain-containing protein, partial [Planctomycetales bacterium]